MSDAVQGGLRAAMAAHGNGLLSRPDECERLLREAAPGRDDEIRFVLAALADGVPSRLVQTLDADAVCREADDLARRTGLQSEQARWAVEAWAGALRPTDPFIALDSPASEAPAAPQPAGDAAARLWLGLRCGAGAGALTGVAIVLLLAVAQSLAKYDDARLPLDWVEWLLLSVTAGLTAGSLASVAGLTRRPELLGAAAGALVGLLGGLIYLPVAASLPGAPDPLTRQVGGAVLGVCVCLIVGGVLGVFQEVLLRLLFKALVYRRRTLGEVLLGYRRWNDEGLWDENQQEWNRRAGL
jgi:hypothetical protein